MTDAFLPVYSSVDVWERPRGRWGIYLRYVGGASSPAYDFSYLRPEEAFDAAEDLGTEHGVPVVDLTGSKRPKASLGFTIERAARLDEKGRLIS